MKIRKVDVVAAKIVDPLDRPKRDGIHLSEILHYIRKKMDPEFAKALTQENLHRFKMGEGFEAGVMSRGLMIDHREHHDHQWRAYTFELNGIRMTTDAVCFGCSRWPLVWEVKLTWLGTKKDIMAPEFSTYHYQLKSYVYALQLELQKKVMGRFVFGHVHGNYTTDRTPRIVAWDVEYTQEELHNNWRMILRVKSEMEEAGLLKGEKSA